MCEQQRCISVQRSIHRVEVNARPYSQGRSGRAGELARAERRGALHGREGGTAGRRAHRRGVEKNEQTSSKRGRATEERPGVRSSLLFLLSSLSHQSSLFFNYIPQLRFTMHRRLQRRTSYSPSDFLNVKTRGSTDREKFLSLPLPVSSLSFSFFLERARLISRTLASIIRVL